MPTSRIGGRRGQGEGISPVGVPGLQLQVPQGDIARVASNLALSDYIGKYVAGEVVHQFVDQNLADQLGSRAIHVSVSWG